MHHSTLILNINKYANLYQPHLDEQQIRMIFESYLSLFESNYVYIRRVFHEYLF